MPNNNIESLAELNKLTAEQIVAAEDAGRIDRIAIARDRKAHEDAARERGRRIGELIRSGMTPEDAIAAHDNGTDEPPAA